MEKKVLYLVFGCPDGCTHTIVIRNVKEGLEPVLIKLTMNTVINNNFLGITTLVDKIIEAKYVIQTLENVDLGL